MYAMTISLYLLFQLKQDIEIRIFSSGLIVNFFERSFANKFVSTIDIAKKNVMFHSERIHNKSGT